MNTATQKNPYRVAAPMQQLQFRFEPELAGITYDDFTTALEKLPYAHVCRVALQLLAATGSRISELDNMDPANLLEGTIYWPPGKHQKGLRHEQLPLNLIDELVHYRRTHRVADGRLLGISASTLVRYFDRDARPLIGGPWMERTTKYRNGQGWREGWRLTLKTFRKTFQTVLFGHFYRRYGDSLVALEWVSKRVKHSSRAITAYHYLQDYELIQAEKWLTWLETGQAPIQSRLSDYTEERSGEERQNLRKLEILNSHRK